MPEFWLPVFIVAPALGWMADYLKATLPRRIVLGFFLAIPIILYAAIALSTERGDHAGSWFLIGLVMVGIFEIAWIGLVTVGFALHRRKRGMPID